MEVLDQVGFAHRSRASASARCAWMLVEVVSHANANISRHFGIQEEEEREVRCFIHMIVCETAKPLLGEGGRSSAVEPDM